MSCNRSISDTEIDLDKFEIVLNKSEIDLNKSEIDLNKSEIYLNKSEIDLNKCEIHLNKSEIDLNKSEIDLNKSEIDLNKSVIDLKEREHFLKAKFDRSEINIMSVVQFPVFVGTSLCSTHIVMALRCWFRGSTSKVQLRNSDTHSEFVGKCRLHRGGHNIDYRSIPQFPPRVLCTN